MNTASPLRVTKIYVVGLFGLYTHTVNLNQEDRVTIIHGPNGVGKTVLLRLVYAFFTGRLSECLRIPMTRLEVCLSNGTTCGIEPSRVDEQTTTLTGKVYVQNGEQRTEGTIEFNQKEITTWAARFADDSPYIARIEPDRWMDRRDNTLYTSFDLLNHYRDRVPDEVRSRMVTEPMWFTEIRSQVGVHIIETQRLLRFGRQEPWSPRSREVREFVSTVNEYARDLSRRIRDALTNYARESQKLDQTFPQRLLEGSQTAFSVDALKARMEKLEMNRDRLQRLGLLDPSYAYPFNPNTLDNVDPTKQSAMTLYVEDTEKKLGVFDDLALRIETLVSNVNSKYRNSFISVTRDEGLVAQTRSEQKLDLDSLSSGEQHELVLFYDLLFRVTPNTLILIDEPELSLHITWQKRFLSDILGIVRITNCDVLLATHSIFIAGDRPDLMVALTQDEAAE
jgi:predicted ATPase